jgi:homoserine dehydrogenase
VELDRLKHLRAVATRRARAVRDVRLVLLGYGRVGQAVARTIRRRGPTLLAHGLRLSVALALVRDRDRQRGDDPPPLTCDPTLVLDPDTRGRRPDLVVEVMGGLRPAGDLVRDALDRGIPVVTANKTLMATAGPELRRLAGERGAALAYGAAVVAGVPFLGALLRRPLVASPSRVAGVLNGTSHFLACELARGVSWADALADAQARGYAEPDSSADTSGRDAAEKLSILLQTIGCTDVPSARLPRIGLEALVPEDFDAAVLLGGVIKPAAMAQLAGPGAGAWVGPCLVDSRHRFARLAGVDNAVEFEDHDGRVVAFVGPGAGPDATAATIVDDVVEVLARGAERPAATHRPRVLAAGVAGRPPAGPWCVRITSPDPPSPAEITRRLAACGLTALTTAHVGAHAYARTAAGPWAAALEAAVATTATGSSTLVLPVIEGV